MSFHLLCELPVQSPKSLDHECETLTAEEVRILKSQIRRNSKWIDQYVARLDLFVNKEGYPQEESFLAKLRKKLFILMEENDTFRRVLWRHCQHVRAGFPRPWRGSPEAACPTKGEGTSPLRGKS